ncbi:MAG TPA: S8 family serine peptidase [Labilithrix sp.]|nr:S8 family serine peptidase [Labilithrix sp.]
MRARGLALCGIAVAVVATVALDAPPARSADPVDEHVLTSGVVRGSPIGAEMLRVLAPRAAAGLARSTDPVGALVAFPRDARAEDLGLEPVAPGIGRLQGTAARVESFASSHPELKLEVSTTLHPLMDRAAQWVRSTQARQTRAADGRGVLVGVADTGLDVRHAEMRDANGRTRVSWLLDLSLPPAGLHPELEERFGLKDESGKVIAGRVFSQSDIDALLVQGDDGSCEDSDEMRCGPADQIGHGTHVTGIAAASGANGGRFTGIAPAADIVFVRVAHANSSDVESDDLVRAVEFMFDRATAEKRPMVVNLSLGSDFGPHDGTLLWEQAIAAQVGPDHPGHVVVAAAGNSGSIVETPIHQSVHVVPGARRRVPIVTYGAENGAVQVWLTLRRGADLKIGLEGPDGEWIAPVEAGRRRGRNTKDYKAGVIYGSRHPDSPIPATSNSAVVVWQDKWPAGTYSITFEGEGMVELYLQGRGDAAAGRRRAASFANGVREGTINLPATHPSIIGVGCTVNRPRWTSIAGADVAQRAPVLDREGGLPIAKAITAQATSNRARDLVDGEVCWFSSAGPTAGGVPKPEIAAPGGFVASALSRNVKPGEGDNMFTSRSCPPTPAGTDDSRCLQMDETHAVATGTSMSSPIVAGVVALLLQRDPTLTQDKVLALLQAGAHRFRAPPPFDDQAGPGEVDALGSLDALEQMTDPTIHLPAREQSWLTLSSDYVTADGSTPMTAIIELRTADGAHRGDFFDAERLRPFVIIDGKEVRPPPQLVRRGPGVWFFVWDPPAGLGGGTATFGATFDGAPVVTPRTVPIAADRWSASYASEAKGSSCASSPGNGRSSADIAVVGLAAAALFRRRRGWAQIVNRRVSG